MCWKFNTSSKIPQIHHYFDSFEKKKKKGKRIARHEFNFCSFTALCFAKESNSAISECRAGGKRKGKVETLCQHLSNFVLGVQAPTKGSLPRACVSHTFSEHYFFLSSGLAFPQLQQKVTEQERLDRQKSISHQDYYRQKQTATLHPSDNSGISTIIMPPDVVIYLASI